MIFRFLTAILFLPVVFAFVLVPNPTAYLLPQISRTRQPLITLSSSLGSSDLYGGDYAGLSASFSAKDGTVIPVPEQYVPKAMLEWGDHPSCWEVLVSESFSSTKNKESLTRQTLQILPEVGCGVDNLDTIKTEAALSIDTMSTQVGENMASFDVVPVESDNKGDIIMVRRTETTFGLPDQHRLRVLADVVYKEETGFELKSPIEIVMERKFNSMSSNGTHADGGGLTGSRVHEWLGPQIRKLPLFCDQNPLEWGAQAPDGLNLVSFPGNITIATYSDGKQSPWMFDVLYVGMDKNLQGEKQVVRRSYHSPTEEE